MSGPRRGLGLLFVLGGVVVLLVAVGSAVAALALGSGSSAAPTTTFAAGETVTAPGSGGLAGPLVVHGLDADVDGSRTLALGCDVVSPGGTERAVASAPGGPGVELDGATLVPLVQVEGARAGDQVTCAGPEAASFEPLALGVAEVPATARVVALVLAAVAVVVGVVFLLVGTRMLRSR